MDTTMIDARQPRFGQGVTGLILAAGYLAAWTPAIPVVAVLLAAASLGGPRLNPSARLFHALVRALRLPPASELEEAAPPRFAAAVGFACTAVATLLLVVGATTAAWVLALIVSALALLAAVTGICVGCELYVLARRLLRGGPPSLRRVRVEG